MLSDGNVNVTPSLKLYLRDRKPFMQLSTPDVQSPRRSRLNLHYGQKTVHQCKKKINLLQQQVRRLKDQVRTFQDLVSHLEEEKHISAGAADKFLVRY